MTRLALLLAGAFFLPAQTHPIEQLIAAARENSPELGSLLARGLPGMKGRDGAVVWGQDFLFAVESPEAAMVSINNQPPTPMRRAGTSNFWYKLATLRLGATHSYTYTANGRSLGAYEVAGYNPDSYPIPGTPQGKLSAMHTHTSRIYPGMTANYWIYANAGVDPDKPSPVTVWQDGETIAGDVDLLRLRLQLVSDNLVHKKLIPPMVHILIAPGTVGSKALRSTQYDTVSNVYGKYLLEEILPEVEKTYKLRADAYSRAIAGASSGAICAFNAAWYFPEQFSRVLSHIGSYSGIQWHPEKNEDGGYIVSHKVRREPRKNLRVWMSDGSNDIENQSGSWPLNNIELANGLKLKGYDFHFRFGTSIHAIAQGALDLPESLAWLWRDYQASNTQQRYEMEESERVKPLFRVSITNREAW
ncbi:alpha/beta hydrolase [Bryobacter aggregatus]|uniref:alpha/beta hydrolase n=1 Tax=Bryobacter aggregatus TaxID=360054 RepID=UPI0004E1C8C4|nr:alpha/beta hydrolase-fold protein [Bryobacter aggregatus]